MAKGGSAQKTVREIRRKRVRRTVRALLPNSKPPPEVAVASLRSMDSIDERVPQRRIEDLVSTGDRSLEVEAVRSLAYRYPTSSALAKWIAFQDSGSATPEEPIPTGGTWAMLGLALGLLGLGAWRVRRGVTVQG